MADSMKTIKLTLEEATAALPSRQRAKGSVMTSVKIEPTGGMRVNRILDDFVASEGKSNCLEGKKYVVLFFGRSTHSLTKTFYVPKLRLIYQNLKENRMDTEFLYVSLDENQAQFDQFSKSQPWPSIPYENEAARKTLSGALHSPLRKKHGGPSVVVVELTDASVNVVNRDAEPAITLTHCETGKDFPWNPSAAGTCCTVVTAALMCTIM